MTGNLTSGQMVPGMYGYVDYNSQGGGQAPTKRVLLWAYMSASAQRTPSYPFMPSSQQDCNDGAGQGSGLARMYQAAISQPEAQGAEIWCMPIPAPSGGTASTYNLNVVVPGTNPTRSGTLQLWIASRPIPAVGFTTADTATTIAAALAAQILTVLDLPIATAVATTGNIVITYRHKGVVGEDLPFRVDIESNGTGVYLSPGTATFTSTASGAGSVRVAIGAQSVSTTLAGTETASQTATAVAASWNASTYALSAAPSGATVVFYMTNGYDVRRVTASIITSTTQTVNLGSGATDGTGSAASTTTNGTVGAGTPTLTNALANLAKLGMYRSWASEFVETTSLGSMATNIEAASDGSITGQKLQTLTVTSPLAASVAGALPTGASPNLTTTAPHYAVCWAPDAAVQGSEISARIAAARASKWIDTPQFNWNGFMVRGSSIAPILIPPNTPAPDELNAALRTYALAPVVLGPSGNMEVIKGRTTSLAADLRLWAWSTETQASYHAVDLAAFFRSRFNGTSIVRYSEPKAAGLIDANSVVAATRERMKVWEKQGNYDGADVMAPYVTANPDNVNPFAIRSNWPESPVLDLDQIIFTSHFTSPPN